MMSEEKSIVVVEDERDTAEMFAEMMNVLGYQVYKCYGGARAVAVISEKKPAAVVLDVMMPDLSGLEVLRYMRRDPRLAHIPVVIVSAKGLPTDIRKGLDAGASYYLTKPVSFSDLKEAVESAIRAVEEGKPNPDQL
jgi:CheY-like chemotaxis protein